jgi:hypothetical protein
MPRKLQRHQPKLRPRAVRIAQPKPNRTHQDAERYDNNVRTVLLDL